ncbi:hypothetical protein [Pseudomonas sp. OV546]|uniref:hypothetical protein n=1 Tax=Pseudomonas sp. OV546 TaxID=1881063 RepID=UPI0008F179EA|nr:hypothetical protein [Pseudomonas sp. OV546]SFV12766.1 hypothetical protein SAMN05428951_11994 [Pseudomonas sp. OV546]
MTDMKTLDQRVAHIERVLPTLSTFNLNVLATIGRHVKESSPETSASLLKDLEGLKTVKYEGLETELIHSHIEALIQMIFATQNR